MWPFSLRRVAPALQTQVTIVFIAFVICEISALLSTDEKRATWFLNTMFLDEVFFHLRLYAVYACGCVSSSSVRQVAQPFPACDSVGPRAGLKWVCWQACSLSIPSSLAQVITRLK